MALAACSKSVSWAVSNTARLAWPVSHAPSANNGTTVAFVCSVIIILSLCNAAAIWRYCHAYENSLAALSQPHGGALTQREIIFNQLAAAYRQPDCISLM